jgi:hypothetical protein
MNMFARPEPILLPATVAIRTEQDLSIRAHGGTTLHRSEASNRSFFFYQYMYLMFW